MFERLFLLITTVFFFKRRFSTYTQLTRNKHNYKVLSILFQISNDNFYDGNSPLPEKVIAQ